MLLSSSPQMNWKRSVRTPRDWQWENLLYKVICHEWVIHSSLYTVYLFVIHSPRVSWVNISEVDSLVDRSLQQVQWLSTLFYQQKVDKTLDLINFKHSWGFHDVTNSSFVLHVLSSNQPRNQPTDRPTDRPDPTDRPTDRPTNPTQPNVERPKDTPGVYIWCNEEDHFRFFARQEGCDARRFSWIFGP